MRDSHALHAVVWVPLPNRARVSKGFYLIQNVADDGDGLIDTWMTVSEWSGRHWISLPISAKHRSERCFSRRHEAEQALDHIG